MVKPSQKPIDDSVCVGIDPYVGAFCEFLRRQHDRGEPAQTISIEGGWGSGKSMFAQRVAERLREDHVPVVEYKPWLHHDADALWVTLAESVHREIHGQLPRRWYAWRMGNLWLRRQFRWGHVTHRKHRFTRYLILLLVVAMLLVCGLIRYFGGSVSDAFGHIPNLLQNITVTFGAIVAGVAVLLKLLPLLGHKPMSGGSSHRPPLVHRLESEFAHLIVAICPTRLKQIQAATKWLTGDGTPTGIEGIRARLQRLADGETLTPEELEELKQWARNLKDIACYLLNQINADPGAFGEEAKMAAEALKMAATEIELNVCDIVDFGPNPDSVGSAIDAADEAILNHIVVVADSVDCNLNGIDDSVDIADGVLAYSDGDGIPDICDMPQRLCADTNADGLVTPADFNAWVLAFNNNDPIADVNQDGLVTPADFNAWVLAFNQGQAGPFCNP